MTRFRSLRPRRDVSDGEHIRAPNYRNREAFALSLGAFLVSLSPVPALGQSPSKPPPLMVVTEELSCRIAVKPRSAGDPASESSQSLPTPERLRIYLKKGGQIVEDPFAVLTPDEQATGPLNYLVTGGTILDTPAGCRNLVGKIAVSESADPIWLSKKGQQPFASTPEPSTSPEPPVSPAQPAIRLANPAGASLTDPDTGPAPAAPVLSTPPAPTRWTSVEKTPVMAEAEPVPDLGSGTGSGIDIAAGFTLGYGTFVGLYIDSNTDIDLSFAGPQAQFRVHPLRLTTHRSAETFLTPLGVWTRFGLLESLRELKITRGGQDIGRQETSLTRLGFGLDYSLRYLGNQHATRLTVTAWERSNLRNSARFDPSAGGKGSSLRDIRIDCTALGLSQSYTTTQGYRVSLGASACIIAEASTPAIADADFPNSKTRFSNSQSLAAELAADWALLPTPDLRLRTALEFKRWVGALELDDGQVIDSAQNIFFASTSLRAEL